MGLAQPVVKVWWNPGKTSATLVDVSDGLGSIDHKEVRLEDGKPVVIENVKFEEHEVEYRAGEAKLATQQCMVVRIDYGKEGSPVLVDPELLRDRGIKVVGYEHRIYSLAHKYTGVFWPVTREGDSRADGQAEGSGPVLRRPVARRFGEAFHIDRAQQCSPSSSGGSHPQPTGGRDPVSGTCTSRTNTVSRTPESEACQAPQEFHDGR
jgi:hypothetical protein